MALRIAFMGTPQFAATSLSAIITAGHEVACVYTRAPKPAGRGKQIQKTPVHQMAEVFGIPVRTPKTLRDADEQSAFAALDVDLAVVVAYGLILPAAILDAPKYGCFNLHGSNLPRWRGAAPIQRAIMAGDSQSAVQIMQMDEGLDTGDIVLSEAINISEEDTAQSLHDTMMMVGADLLVRALSACEREALVRTPQSQDGVMYADKIDKKEARIRWDIPAKQLDCHIRGLSPFPGAWFEIDTPKGPLRVKALHSKCVDGTGKPGEILGENLSIAACDGAVQLLRVQPAGGKAQDGAALMRGYHIPVQTRLL